MYYASLFPELALHALRFLHHLHVWLVHGLSLSVLDVLLLANTKASYDALHRRFVTHRNFLRADANLQVRPCMHLPHMFF